MPISPDMLSPETVPVKASVSGIGLVMEIFQATSSPLAVPSKISPELPSAPCVPVSVPPAFFKVSVALRSPIGVVMTIFQFPSTAISWSPHDVPVNRNGSEMLLPGRRYSLSESASPTLLFYGLSSPCGSADPAADQEAECGILDAEGGELGPDQHDGDIERPQLHVAGHRDPDGAGGEREHQRGPGEAGEGNVFRNG